MSIYPTMLPILFCAGLGYLSIKFMLLKQTKQRLLSKTTRTVFIPALLFVNTATLAVPSGYSWHFLAAYYCGVIVVFVLTNLISRCILRTSLDKQGSFSVAATYSNTVMVGIPVCLYMLGERALLPVFILLSINTLVVFGLGIIWAEWQSTSVKSLSKRIFNVGGALILNPLIASLLMGSLLRVLHITIPPVIEHTLAFIAQAALPLSLFILGASLYQYSLRKQWRPALVISLIKLIVLPLCVWLFSRYLFELKPLWASVATLVAAMPVGLNAYFFSDTQNSGADTVGASILISTLLSLSLIHI